MHRQPRTEPAPFKEHKKSRVISLGQKIVEKTVSCPFPA
jgi:hypothetical protein